MNKLSIHLERVRIIEEVDNSKSCKNASDYETLKELDNSCFVFVSLPDAFSANNYSI